MAARFRVLDNGTLRDIKSLFAMQAGVSRRARTLKVMDGDELRTVGVFAPPLSVSANNVFGAGFQNSQSGSSTAAPTGGLAPFTYAWTRVSGETLITSGANSAKANFASGILDPYQTRQAVYRVTVTDSLGQTASADITVLFQYSPGPIG